MPTSDFWYGALFSFALISASGMFLKSKFKPETVMKMLQIITETIKKSKHSTEVRLENDVLIVKDSNYVYHLPAIPVHHLYDVKYFSDAEHTEELDITFFRYKNHYVYSYFQPKQYGLKKVYVAVKYLTKDNYMYFGYEENDIVNIPACLHTYDISHSITTEASLAEAYD
jgi:hypothetical protein